MYTKLIKYSQKQQPHSPVISFLNYTPNINILLWHAKIASSSKVHAFFTIFSRTRSHHCTDQVIDVYRHHRRPTTTLYRRVVGKCYLHGITFQFYYVTVYLYFYHPDDGFIFSGFSFFKLVNLWDNTIGLAPYVNIASSTNQFIIFDTFGW